MLDPFPTAPTVRTPLGRLLHQISWENKVNAYYREGGRGMENVLTTEVILAPSSRLRLVSLQNWGHSVWHFAHQKAIVGRDASMQWTISPRELSSPLP